MVLERLYSKRSFSSSPIIDLSTCLHTRRTCMASILGTFIALTRRCRFPGSKRQLQQQVSGRVNVIGENQIPDVDYPILDEGRSSRCMYFGNKGMTNSGGERRSIRACNRRILNHSEWDRGIKKLEGNGQTIRFRGWGLCQGHVTPQTRRDAFEIRVVDEK